MIEEIDDIKNYIYLLSDPTTNKVVYVGKTKNPKKRYKDHCRISKNEHKTKLFKWKNSIIKSGKFPIMTVILETSNIDKYEKYYISLFKSNGHDILNMTDGGDGLQNPSPEVRKKIGEKSKGRKMTQKTKDAIFKSTFNKGKEIVCYDNNYNFIGKFNNSRRASEKLNISWKNISDILNNGMCFNKNYTFFFSNDKNIKSKLKSRIESLNKKGFEFYRVSINGEKKLYNNIIKAGAENNTSFKNIWMCLNKQRKTSGGFAWIYENEILNTNYENLFNKKTKGYKIISINIETNDEIKFDSISEASKYFKMKTSTISKYVKNGIEKNGYIFKYY